jgi:thiamine-monophosphate kinase
LNELQFIDRLKAITTHPAARGLVDDVAMMPFGRHKLVMTHDMMVEGVHFLRDADPADVAWKLVAVNLSDLAAKGAKPLGILLGYGRTSGDQWDEAFVEGLKQAIDRFAVPLLGGDTVAMGENAPRTFGLTAIGEAKGHIVPSRSNAKPGHAVYVTGTIGDAWAGLQIASGSLRTEDIDIRASLLKAHTRPTPRLEEGRVLSNLVSSMMDVSD